jgi:hypothetical protein
LVLPKQQPVALNETPLAHRAAGFSGLLGLEEVERIDNLIQVVNLGVTPGQG